MALLINDRQTIVVVLVVSAQRVPEPDLLPDIYLDTRPDPIQF